MRRAARGPLLSAGLLVVLLAACGGGAPASSTAVLVASPSASPAVTAAPTPGPTPELLSAPPPAESPSTGPTDSPAPAPLDPCSLITRAEANAVTGTKPGDPMPAGNPPDRCTWPTPPTGHVGQVEVGLGDGAKKAYDIDNKVLHHEFKTVAGLGDEGYSENAAVFFRVGETWVALNVVRLDDSSRWMPKLIALAKTVAGRLQAPVAGG